MQRESSLRCREAGGGWEMECAPTRDSTASGTPGGASAGRRGPPGAGGGRSHLARGRTSQVPQAGRLGARPRDPAPPGTLVSAGGGHTAPTHRQPGRAAILCSAAGEPGERPGLAGGGAGPGRELAARAPRRGQWLGLDDRCGGAGLAEGGPRSSSGPVVPKQSRARPAAGRARGPGLCGRWGPRPALSARSSGLAQIYGR